MKAYTDLSQSKKLAEILPLESADMKWYFWKSEIDAPKLPTFGYDKDTTENCKNTEAVYLPCWSLVALLDVLESEIDGENGETYKLNIEKDGTWWDVWYCEEHDEENPIETTSSEELIDVCYKMILKLKERKLI